MALCSKQRALKGFMNGWVFGRRVSENRAAFG